MIPIFRRSDEDSVRVRLLFCLTFGLCVSCFPISYAFAGGSSGGSTGGGGSVGAAGGGGSAGAGGSGVFSGGGGTGGHGGVGASGGGNSTRSGGGMGFSSTSGPRVVTTGSGGQNATSKASDHGSVLNRSVPGAAGKDQASLVELCRRWFSSWLTQPQSEPRTRPSPTPRPSPTAYLGLIGHN
jgi:hypothetical protein